MKYRLFDAKEDHKNISEWWRARKGWQPIPVTMLSDLGIIAYDDEHDYCAVWLYPTGPGKELAWMEWLVSNPKAPVKERREALGLVIDHAAKIAKELGITKIFTSIKHEKLEKLYQEKGFKITDTGVTHLIKEVE